MGYEGVSTIQRANFEYIQEIDGKWYYLDEVLRYSKPFNIYSEARDGLLKYFKEYADEKEKIGTPRQQSAIKAYNSVRANSS